jgi:hypothetical protein
MVGSVSIVNQSFSTPMLKVGNTLQANYSFSDPDTDAESGTRFQWLRGAIPINGAMASTYIVEGPDINAGLTVRVTPATNPANTDPAEGTPVTSPVVDVVKDVPLNFVASSITYSNWTVAFDFCASTGGRMATITELEKVYLDSTRAPFITPNDDICDFFGWPIRSKCGGSDVGYTWSGTQGSPQPPSHYSINFQTGEIRDSDDIAYYSRGVCVY